ncbi:hypothetical protein CO230_01595 [Chryseobacterium sp. 6424]|nr:hypothetical protein CO230_01595 [Chryseobacterium sp. 6424]
MGQIGRYKLDGTKGRDKSSGDSFRMTKARDKWRTNWMTKECDISSGDSFRMTKGCDKLGATNWMGQKGATKAAGILSE